MIEVQLVDGRIIEFPDGTSPEVIKATAAKATKDRYFGVSTEELEKQPRAPMSVGDIGRTGLASLVGATGSIASAFGAETAPARGLRELAGEIQQGMTPERQEEIRRREELMRRAGEKGILPEVGAGVGAVTEAPYQAIASGLGSSVPAIVAGLGAMVAGAPLAIAGAVVLTAKLAIGAIQGAGETKGNIFESVTQKLMDEKGLSRAEAEAQAIKAQEYLGKNATGIMGGAAAGMLDAVLGGPEAMIGKGFKKAATRPLTQPSYIKTGLKEAFEEAVPEAIQAGVGQVAENVALQNAGIDTSTFQGVAGAVARDALMGALTGGAVSPLQMSSLRKEYAQDKERRLNEEQSKIDEEIRKEEETLRQQQEQVAAQERAKEEEIVAAPPVEVKAPKNVHPVRNPLGNIEKEDLEQQDPYLAQHVDEYRKNAGLPPLQSYSIEDVVDAMPGVSPSEEQGIIDSILNSRTGYQGERLTAQDVIDQAQAKELETDQAFNDFLTRTTGQGDLRSMSQPQLYAAFKAIQELPVGSKLELGTNAVLFTDKQYEAALNALDQITEPVLVSEALSDIKLSTGLKEDTHAQSILEEAVRRGDVDREGDKISPPSTAAVLPKGYEIQEGMFERGEKPEGFQVKVGEEVQPEVYSTEEEANQKAQEVTKVQGKMSKDITNQIQQREADLAKAEENLTRMQTAGQRGLAYDKAFAKLVRLRRSTADAVARLNDQLARTDQEKAPVSVVPAKARKVKGKGFTLFKDKQAVKVLKTREEAERAILEELPEEQVQALTKAKGRRTLKKRAEEEVARRAAPEPKVEPKPEPKPEFEKTLRALLDRFGLKDVALNIDKDMKADGEYSKAVIKVALDSANPVRTLRHESIHALKELGFFTPQQWKALENSAKTKWIDTYLKGRNINGEPLEAGQQSRYDAYMNVYKGDQDAIIEEAIADAFGDFDMTKAPPGLMTAILKRLKLFFEAMRNALTGAGFQTYEDVFGQVERGALEPVAAPTEAGVKLSLGKVPLSTRAVMEMDDKSAREALGLKTEAVRNVFNNVRDIALALNNETINSDGKMDRLNLTAKDQNRIANAIADEVEYQLGTTAKTGTGLGWYSKNYPNAVKRLGNRFPELKTNKHARSVFSALVAVTSNGEKVNLNIKNAIDLYSKLRDGKKLVGIGSRRATALENNLKVIQDLLDQHDTDFEKVLLREITVKDMNAALREMGEEPDGSYLADTVVPAAAIYFGPKLGAFYANLSGSEGYLTMDLWWTRSINRMRGLLQPQATEASINKFRDMMGRPDASREEVVAATIPLRNKYEEYGFNTELEHLAGEKEPAKKDQKSKWFKRAEKAAGNAYEQLLFEHNLEKMANTIYKNEYEMLEEAPFTATDRKFMYDAARDAQTMLRERGIDLTLADIQAALWYYEKRLYQKLSGRKADDIGYEEAIIAQSGETGGRVQPSVVFGGEPSGRAEPGAEVTEAPAVREAGREPTKKLSLRDTPQFKNWFGDSKIVNADGSPKVMYHGTARDITVFQPKQADAIFVTDDPNFAAGFASQSADWVNKNAKKLLTPEQYKEMQSKVDAVEDIDEKDAIRKEYVLDKMNAGENIMPVYVSAQNPFDYANKAHVKAVLNELTNPEEWADQISRGNWNYIETNPVQEAIKFAGFDGFYVLEGGRKNLAVYNSEQIKSATGNSGMYDKYNPDIRYNLRESTPADIRAAVDRVTTARDDRTHAERITGALRDDDTWSNFRAQALNRYNRLADYDKALVKQMGGAKLLADSSAEAAALMSDLGAGLTASALGVHDRLGGIPVYKNGVTTVTNLNNTVKGPVAIFAPLSKYGDPYVYQLYQFWAGSKRGKRLMADGKEQVYTPAMLSYAQRLEKQYPEFDSIQKEWVKYNNGLVEFLVDTGVLSKDKANEFTRYSDYVPFYRQFEGEQTIGPNLFTSISGVKGPKKLKGGEAPLADFLETIVRNTQSSIQMGIKNVAAQRAAEVAVKINEAKRLDHVSSGADVFTVLENGKLTYYQSGDQLFINAIKSLNIPDLPFIGLLAGPANMLRNLVTKDPAFMLANMVRDSMSAYVTSGADFKPVVSTIANFGKAIAGTSPEYQALLNAGLIGGYEFSQNVGQSSKTMEEAMRIKAGMKTKKDRLLGVWQALEKGTTASDAATRIEVYKATMAETGNEAEALFRAMEVMNFNRKGSSAVIRVLTAAIPFLNARIQGLDVLYRAGIRPTVQWLRGKEVTEEEAARQRTFVVRGLTIAALSCMYWALTHDDDEYKKQEQEVRDNYWLVPSLGVKIPTPFEVGILFKVIPERIMAYSFGDDTGKDFAKSMGKQLMNTLAFNPIPQTALPLVEIATNHSFFTGRDIVSQGLEGVAPEFQVGPGTSLMAQWIGSQAGLSPIQIDHLVKGYTGTMGGYLVDMLDMVMDLNGDSPKVSKRIEQMPFIKRFALDPEARGTVSAFYEMKDSVDEVTRTINLLERTGDYKNWGEYYQDNMNMLAMKDYIQDLEKQMKELREMKVMIRSSQMSGDEKRDSLLDITKMENQLTSNMQQLKKLVSK